MTEDERMRSYISNRNAKHRRYALEPTYFWGRLSKASGVPKCQVKKVMEVMGDVVYEEMARCGKIALFKGVIFEGVWKNGKGRKYHNIYTGEVQDSNVVIRAKCNFTPLAKKRIHEFYYKHREEEQNETENKK